MLRLRLHYIPVTLRRCAEQNTIPHLRKFMNSAALRQYINFPNNTDWLDNSNAQRTSSSSWTQLAESVNNPKEKKTTPNDAQSAWTSRETQVAQLPPPDNAYTGRSVAVRNKDVGGALAMLKSILHVNAVRSTNIRDERHEKKGEKRNRLRSLRWRRRFAHEVRKKVQLVNEIRARGA